MPFVVTDVEENSPNKNNIQPKDIITNFNGIPVKYADELLTLVKEVKGKKVPVIVKREDKEVALTLTVNDSAKMGIGYAGRLPYDNLEKLGLYHVSEQDYGFFESFPIGIEKGKNQLVGYRKNNYNSFFSILAQVLYKGVGGFAAIFNIFPNAWSWELFGVITFTFHHAWSNEFIPIPALDGGHVMFLLYEMISGKKPSD